MARRKSERLTPEQRRKVVELRDEDGRSFDQIAERYGIGRRYASYVYYEEKRKIGKELLKRHAKSDV